MDNLDKSWFAYPSMRKYPIHTKEAALQSYDEFSRDKFTMAKALSEDIKQRFDKAASFHEVELKAFKKEASEPVSDILLLKGKSGDLAISKITSIEEFKSATEFILDKRASMKRADLQEAAKYVVWVAANSDVEQDTPELRKIARIAGIGVGDRDEIQETFEKRADMCVLSDKDRGPFWEYANELRNLPDEEFYKEATLNKICDTIEEIDEIYNNTYRYGKDITAPEDAVFGSNMDDLLKEAKDLMYVESIDATLSKSALLQRKEAAQAFLAQYLAPEKPYNDEELIAKVASLDAKLADQLLEAIK